MFDGNHRSRRQVDLSSGGRRRKAGAGKATAGGPWTATLTTEGGGVLLAGGQTNQRSAILEESRRLREERSRQQVRVRACQSIQRVFRGHRLQRALVRELDGRLASPDLLHMTEDRTSCLNLRLAYPPLQVKFVAQSLEEYARCLSASPASGGSLPPPLAHRIVRSTLHLVGLQRISADDARLIFRYTTNTSDSNRLRLQLGTTGLVALLETLQNLDPKYQSTLNDLWQLALSATPQTVTGLAALGAVALGHDHCETLNVSHDLRREWFSCLVQVLCASPSLSSTPSTPAVEPLVAAVHRLQERRSPTILSRALDLFRTQSPVPLMRYLQRSSGTLLAVGSLLVRGDSLDDETLRDSTKPAKDANKATAMEVDGEDDDSDADDAPTRVRAPSVAVTTKSSRSSAAQWTKQELQTLPKIDRSYHTMVGKWRESVLDQLRSSPSRSSTVTLAKQICDPELWLQWGKALFSSLESSEDVRDAQDAYVTVLATLLQATTGLYARHSVSSHFLTALALDATFLERLWRYVLVLRNNAHLPPYLALSVFCDVLSHRLVAMKDEQFLREYTHAQAPVGGVVISAEHVIATLRDVLHELYWTKPVRAIQVTPLLGSPVTSSDPGEAIRGRLLLTGTKLWQSLYERWCRLVRHAPFCDESTWCFPNLTASKQSVVGVRHHHGGPPYGDGSADMDLESSDDEDEGVARAQTAAEAEVEALADAFSDAKMARVLTCIPQALPFDRRVKMFHSLLATDKLRTQDEESDMRQIMLMAMRGEEGEISTRERISIHRDRLYEDSMRQLNQLGHNLKKRVQVSFINQHGQAEAGIDGGGVFKEFIDDLIKEAFSVEGTSSFQLFSVTPLQTLAINANLPLDDTLLSHYEFLGRVLGKAVYESILVEPQFCLPFLNQLLGKANSLEDLKNFDSEFYQNLTKLLLIPPEDIADLGLSFELDGGVNSHSVELVHGGRDIKVSKSNVIQYVHLVAHHRLNIQGAFQTKAFLRGFRDLVPASWVRLFSAYELQKLISGDDSIRGIDVSSLKGAMRYAAGYHPSQPVIRWFWEIVEEMSAEQQRQFLKFMTSCSRQPLLGFASLDPAPCIQQIRLPEEELPTELADKNTPLPTSSTCMNLLKLPNYRSKGLMKTKLLAAIESGAGFELT